MHPETLTYSRAGDLGASHETISITIMILPGETAQQAVDLAKRFVDHNMTRGIDPDLSKAKSILESPDDYTGKDVKWAKDFIAALPQAPQEPIL